jgi:asparagine synthase (glutamine-hydrolysing)
MCGIAGEIRFDGQVVHPGALERMNEALARRGPDSTGYFAQGSCGFAHSRLQIFDLSEKAQQPMVDSQLGLSLVFNGAIYNYKELRKELEAKGYNFFSSGDTEVILKAYKAWGDDCVEKLSGMFAFVIYERDTGRVFAARDRLGIKPFYYSLNSKRFAFASTLPALIRADDVNTELDPIALHHYLTFHAVVPPPQTILKGVRKLPPGHIGIIEAGKELQIKRYWSLDFTAREDEKNLSYKEWKDRTRQALELAVDRRLVADVPVGVLLSGGLDSSLITALLARKGQQGLNTFSIGFESYSEEKGDEFEYSDIIAKHFKTDHHKIFVESSDTLEALKETIGSMSEPMVSHDNVGFYLLSKEVKKHVKVVQSGQGADEVFAGYHWYPKMMDVEPEQAFASYSNAFFDRDHSEMQSVLRPEYLSEDFSSQFVEQYFAEKPDLSAIDQALRIDQLVMLVDDPVKRVDNMTMAWGLEARVPFLDHDLVELAARVPAEHKVADGGKGILKDIGREVMPSEVIDRPKGYFPVPALKYLRGPFLEFVQETLSSEKIKERGVFNEEYIDLLKKEPEKHITRLRGSKLWQLTLLEAWLQKHSI